MALFRRSGPADLAAAMAAYRRVPREKNALTLLGLPAADAVVLGVAELPPGIQPGDPIPAGTQMQHLDTTTPDGAALAYPVFTSLDALAGYAPSIPAVTVPGDFPVREVAADGRYAALVVDPGPEFAALPRAWVERAAADL